MAFKLQPNTAPFSYKITIPVVNDNGTAIRHQVEFRFKRLSRLDFDAMVSEHRAPEDQDGKISAAEALDSNTAQVMAFTVGWSGVTGADDQQLEFTAANVRDFLNLVPGAFNALISGYIEAWQGGASRKN